MSVALVNWNGSGTLPSEKDCLVRSRSQWIDMGGFGRLGDELGDGGEFEASSCPGWLESD